ncbi:PRD domain-containing protein [Enterococcus casseliflavus]|uniref:PRD domain-containing protein n=1 Tax=Enterococcus casseliflavus TaxID=37734 RepID=UPI0035E0E581
MKITRVLNTNAVTSTTNTGDEVVLLGAGIGFKAKPNDDIDLAKVEKRFTMKDKGRMARFQELVNSIPSEIVLISEELISIAKLTYDLDLNESIHISLADHINSSINSKKNGIEVTNTLLTEIKQFYREEFALGILGLQLIKEKLSYSFTDDEAGFIAMHFINSERRNAQSNAKR